MYPRNAASPERFDIGPVVQILDGVVQTSGVSVSVLPMGAGSGAAAGTIAYENGIVVYTPTQAETNYTSVVFVAYKTGCIPASKTVVFSASGTAGYAGTDQSKIANPTATVALTNTSIKDVATVGGEVMRGTDAAYTGTPPTADAIGTDAASKVLATPANKLATNASGEVTPTAASKTGYALSATGLDTITATRPAGVATTFPQMLVQLFYRFFGKATKTSTQLKTYAANGTTVVTTQTVSDDGTTETQGETS